jgi:hypothetical protein
VAQASGLSVFNLGASGALGGAIAHQSVQLGAPEYRSWSGGVFLYGNGIGSLVGLAVRERVAINIHGGAAGLETRVGGELYLGPSIKLFDGGALLLNLGLQGYGLANDELRASILQLPAAEVALLFSVEGATLALGPTSGLALRTEYAPGDEDQGRRHRRLRTSDLASGGFVSFTSEHVAVDASLTRLIASEPLWVADGEACLFFSPLALCGFAQYWRSTATLAQPGLPLAPDLNPMVPTVYVGGALAIGASGTSR